jgi:hypothetical protein
MRWMILRSAFLTLVLLACCGAGWADQSTPPSIAPFIPRTRSVRPVVAAGLHYIYSLDASFYEVIRRNEDGTPGAVVVPGSSLAEIFGPLIAQLNASADYPAATGIKKCPANPAGAAYVILKRGAASSWGRAGRARTWSGDGEGWGRDQGRVTPCLLLRSSARKP